MCHTLGRHQRQSSEDAKYSPCLHEAYIVMKRADNKQVNKMWCNINFMKKTNRSFYREEQRLRGATLERRGVGKDLWVLLSGRVCLADSGPRVPSLTS
jgi:hypothetical protein